MTSLLFILAIQNHTIQIYQPMKPLLPFLILLSLTFSINSLATETNLTHKPLELSYSYKLLIEIDNASE